MDVNMDFKINFLEAIVGKNWGLLVLDWDWVVIFFVVEKLEDYNFYFKLF